MMLGKKKQGEETSPFDFGKRIDPELAKEAQRVDTNPIVGVCPACKIELRKVMWFSCNKEGCPTFPPQDLLSEDDEG